MKLMEKNRQPPIRNVGALSARGRRVIVSTLDGAARREEIPSDAISGELWQPDMRKDATVWRLLAGLAEALHRAARDGMLPQWLGKHMLRVMPGQALYLVTPASVTAQTLEKERWFARISPPEQQRRPAAPVTAAQTSYAFAALLVSIIGQWPGCAMKEGSLREDLAVNPFTGSIPALEQLPDDLPRRQALLGMLYQALAVEPQCRPSLPEWQALLTRCAAAVAARAAMMPPTLPPEATLVTGSGQYGVMLAGGEKEFACRYRAIALPQGAAEWDDRFDGLSRSQRRQFRVLQLPVDRVRNEGRAWLLYEQCCPGPVLPRQADDEPVPAGIAGELLTLLQDVRLASSMGIFIRALPSLPDGMITPDDVAACDDLCAAVTDRLAASMADANTVPEGLRRIARQHEQSPMTIDEWINALQAVW